MSWRATHAMSGTVTTKFFGDDQKHLV